MKLPNTASESMRLAEAMDWLFANSPDRFCVIRDALRPNPEWLIIRHRFEAPDQPGVYIFEIGDRKIYIGHSVNVRARLKGHRWHEGRINGHCYLGNPSDVRIAIKRCLDVQEAKVFESHYIAELRPELNVQGNG